MKTPSVGESINLKRRCPICNHATGRRLFNKKAGTASATLGFGYDVVVCSRCGFGFADGIPEQKALDKYYEELSKYDAEPSMATGSDYQQAYFSTIVGIIQDRFPKLNIRILDVGCATGRLLAFLKQAGYANLTGLDPSQKSSDLARELYGIKVEVGSFFNFQSAYKFDLIILSGVLEHIGSIQTAMLRITEMLRSGGGLYVCVPDASRFCEAENAPFQEFSQEHINFFSPASLTNLMASAGLEPMEGGIYRKLTASAFRTTSPVIHAIFRKGKSKPTVDLPLFDPQTENALTRYIRQSFEALELIRKEIDRLVIKGEPVIVWGIGAHTQNLFAVTNLGRANIIAFVDSNKNYYGRTFHGLPICAPTELSGRNEPILVSSRVYQEEIRSQIRRELGLANELILLYEL